MTLLLILIVKFRPGFGKKPLIALGIIIKSRLLLKLLFRKWNYLIVNINNANAKKSKLTEIV